MQERNRRFSGNSTHRALTRGTGGHNLPQVYVPAGKGRLPELYMRDAKARMLISRLKWFISTCIVGAAGLCIIGIAMYASTDMEDGSGLYGSIRSATLAALKPKATGNLIEDKIALPGEKTDKVKITTKGLSTRYIIQDSVVQRKNAREFITVKPYVRITATLSTIKPDNADKIPAFNPFDLYVQKKGAKGEARSSDASPIEAPHNKYLSVKLIEVAGGFMPEEDQQLMPDDEVERLVAEANAVYSESSTQLEPADQPSDSDASNQLAASQEADEKLVRTTVLEKILDDDEQIDGNELRSIIVNPGDTLIGLLTEAGAETWQAQAISDAFKSGKKKSAKLRVGQEIRLIMAPAASNPSSREPTKVSIFSGVKSEGTAVRSADGGYTMSDEHVQIGKLASKVDNTIERATLYTSIYAAALAQELDKQTIKALLRTFSYDVDYKQKVRPGDGFELFFDVKPGQVGSEEPGELLYVSMTVGDKIMKYYRYRTPEGTIDFYNPEGSNSRKFLMRKPIKSGRFTSGFGYRRHPLLGIKKMHTGVDWAAPRGTPIMAAGSGTLELAGRRGGNGNYVRIRHGNGYKTAYSHLNRFAKGIKKGAKVTQGQLIGYVGTTGMSTGPHLHYEVLINNRFTNPLKIHVPRSRQLNSRMLSEFKKEMQRIDELMHRAPVKTRIASAKD